MSPKALDVLQTALHLAEADQANCFGTVCRALQVLNVSKSREARELSKELNAVLAVSEQLSERLKRVMDQVPQLEEAA